MQSSGPNFAFQPEPKMRWRGVIVLVPAIVWLISSYWEVQLWAEYAKEHPMALEVSWPLHSALLTWISLLAVPCGVALLIFDARHLLQRKTDERNG
jgi:hypothetical protein